MPADQVPGSTLDGARDAASQRGQPPPRTLRSTFEPGTTRWATRRAQWRALGLTDEDMAKPKIAVVNSSSNLAICFSHLDEIAARTKAAIARAGGVGFEVRTTAPSDFIHSAGHRGGYILASRDLIVNDIEVGVEGALLDGMICLASCDKTAPAQLMAAGRLNIPTVIVACGYQPCGVFQGGHCDIEDVFLAASHYARGRIDLDQLTEMSENAVQGPGVCAGMGTANTMHLACEALGMALPGSTPVLANSPRMWEAVERAAQQIVEMVWADRRPRDILTPGAFGNAVAAVLAVSGSINAVKHLQAVAAEAGCDVDVYELFERLSERVPLLAAIRPSGPHSIEEFEAAGGSHAVLRRLAALDTHEPPGVLDLDARTLTGRSLGTELATEPEADLGAEAASRLGAGPDEEIIRTVQRPFGRRPTIVLVRGSLAPATGIVKLAVADDRDLRFTGPAKVYESAEAAIDGIAAGEIQAGQVLVLRGLGLTGSPGMGMASRPVFELDGAGLTGRVAVVTDGQLSGLVNKGIVVGEVSPEAAAGGPLALVEDGDTISIDVLGRRVDLDVPADQLAARRTRLDQRATAASQAAADPDGEVGWLAIYRQLVRPLPGGAVLTESRPSGGPH